MRTVMEMDLIVEAVIKAAKEAQPWAVEHVAQRMDGKVREQVEVKKGQSGNPLGRTSVPPAEREWMKHLRTATFRKVEIGPDGKALPFQHKEGAKVDRLTVAADVVLDLACAGNCWAVEHVANRFDGKVREQVEVTHNTNLKVRYESYEEVRAALLEGGINIDRLPMLEDLRSVEEQEPEQEPS
jgi:hypothetical protein